MSTARWRFRLLTIGITALPWLTLASPVGATSVQYAASHLDGAHWRYTYTVSGTELVGGQGFDVSFDPTLYSALREPSVSPDFSGLLGGSEFSLLVQPGLVQDALFIPGSFLALVRPSDSGGHLHAETSSYAFSVEFDWLGDPSTSPSNQPWNVLAGLEIVPGSVLIGNIIDSGTTVPVPEPGSGALLGISLVSLTARKRRLTRSTRSLRRGGYTVRRR